VTPACGSAVQARGSAVQVRGSAVQVRGSAVQVRGSAVQVRGKSLTCRPVAAYPEVLDLNSSMLPGLNAFCDEPSPSLTVPFGAAYKHNWKTW
jgi:hypothetical protein